VVRPVLFFLGWVFFALGAVGVVVPGLPTTPFMLLALWAFSRSSRRFHHWLFHHKVFGPPLQRWEDHKVISWPTKALSLTFMTAALVYMVVFSGLSLWVTVVVALVMAYGAYFILTKPSRLPKDANPRPLRGPGIREESEPME
jgi:uncharacterized membrane protein YbaN (DUF454 family)